MDDATTDTDPTRLNRLDQPIGAPVDQVLPVSAPSSVTMVGRWCRVAPLDADEHGAALFEAFDEAPDDRPWTYLFHERSATVGDFMEWFGLLEGRADPLYFVISDAEGPCGMAAFLRPAPDHGVIEVGGIHLAPRLQGTTASTEAMYLMMQRVFDTGYRRYEWKCDSLNQPSRSAARRLGFVYEGDFRQAIVYKGRNRDTSWFSILDGEWPALQTEFERWLDPSNFDDTGRQRTPLRHEKPGERTS